MSEDRIVSLYHDVRAATGWDIGYFAVDARLFPISASNTGIFYAPAKLSDHRVLNLPDGRVLPFEFFRSLATTNGGSNIPIQFVARGDQIQSRTIQYQAAFYLSMFYRAYIGYSPKDLNSTDTGVPGFSQALQANPPVPAWNLTHWRVVYPTADYNPLPPPAEPNTPGRGEKFYQTQRQQSPPPARDPPRGGRLGTPAPRANRGRGSRLDDHAGLPRGVPHRPRHRLLRPEPRRLVRGGGHLRARRHHHAHACIVRLQPLRDVGDRRDLHGRGSARRLVSRVDRVERTHVDRRDPDDHADRRDPRDRRAVYSGPRIHRLESWRDRAVGSDGIPR